MKYRGIDVVSRMCSTMKYPVEHTVLVLGHEEGLRVVRAGISRDMWTGSGKWRNADGLHKSTRQQ